MDVSDRTVIRVVRVAGNRYSVRVSDAVGAISVAGADFIVHPKIPESHLLYLLQRSELLPRLDPQRTALAPSKPLWELVATWYVDAAEQLLRRDLIRDYQERTDDLQFVRGRIHPTRTATALLTGRIAVRCEFEEFSVDTALNRVVRAAALTVTASTLLPSELRRRARRVSLRLDGIGELQRGDLISVVDRRTSYYQDAITLGQAILASTGRALHQGNETSWSFLIRTPEMIEAGVRTVLAEGLGRSHEVTKRRVTLDGSTKTLNPDLVFDGDAAVGDVKYKVTTGDWNNSDLYQIVAFATGLRTRRAAVVSFPTGGHTLPTLKVGDVEVTHLPWRADADLDPADAAADLIEATSRWLSPA